jgi:hypothetical protein
MPRLLAVVVLVFACAAPPLRELHPEHPASPRAAEAPEPPRSTSLDAESEPTPTEEAAPHVH